MLAVSGPSLLRRMALAIPDAILHRRAFHSLTEGLREEHGEQLKEWDRMVREWTVDHSKPNPYDVPEDGTRSLGFLLSPFLTRFLRRHPRSNQTATGRRGERTNENGGCFSL